MIIRIAAKKLDSIRAVQLWKDAPLPVIDAIATLQSVHAADATGKKLDYYRYTLPAL